ncbi:MAG TPA: sigma-70 family RNA polymerase sigma factor [Desulfitobacteriaceae bacterium]|nr:sigma-70 family RNA polymerase sigma factor [Desulfitobacteriaceae bacterium]
MEDAELIRQVLTGRQEQYAFLVERYQEPLIHFLRNFLASDDQVFDCAQDTFLAAYRNLWRYSEKYTFRAWLYAIGRNKAIDILRKRRHEVVATFDSILADGLPGPEEIWLAKEHALVINKILEGLPEYYRQALYLRYHQDLSYEEIAAVLKLPVSRVKTYLHRGKEKLRRELARRGIHARNGDFLEPTVQGQTYRQEQITKY